MAATSESKKEALRDKIHDGFRTAYNTLLQTPTEKEELAAWTELYRLSTRFYPRLTRLGGKDGVPFAFVNAHHFSVPFWIRRSLERPLGTLLHFDTHSDMEGIPRPDDVKEAIADIKAGRKLKRSWHILAHAVYRNSMPVTAAVLAAGVREVVWAKPEWARDPVDFLSKNFFLARTKGMKDPRTLASLEAAGPAALSAAYRGQISDFLQVYYDPKDNNDVWLPKRQTESETWSAINPKKRPHEKFFEGIHRFKLSVLTTDRPGQGADQLPKAISGKDFVLDIDLDYFVNIGSDVEVTDDPPSYGQRMYRRGDQPDSTLAIFHSRSAVGRLFVTEREIIERRFRRFRHLLRSLKAAGKRPSVVTIADSTHLPFTSFRQGQEHSSFVPSHHAYWVHDRIVSVIREVFGKGPRAAEPGPTLARQPAEPKRDTSILKSGHPAITLVLPTINEALASAVAWATGAATTYKGTNRLSVYLMILHAIAAHGPDVRLRRAAATAARIHAQGTLAPLLLGPSLTPNRGEIQETLRRVEFARRYGNHEFEMARDLAHWFRQVIPGGVPLPDFDAQTAPMKPSKAFEKMGYTRALSAPEANLVDALLALQATDGGFGTSDVPPLHRAFVSLLAVRGILYLLPTVDLPPPSRKPLWKNFPVTRAQLDDSVLSALMFTITEMGELPSTDEASDGLLLFRSVSQANNADDAAKLVGRISGKLLASRVAVKLDEMLRDAKDVNALIALAELGATLKYFGVDVTKLRAGLIARVSKLSRNKVLGLKGAAPKKPGEVFRSVARSYALESFGVPLGGAFLDMLKGALPLTANLTLTSDSNKLVDRFNAVAHVLLTCSANRQVALKRADFPGEWRFLEDIYVEVLASRRPDMVSALLESRRILGDNNSSHRVRNLIWQLLNDQHPLGFWGRIAEPKLRSTWASVSALLEYDTKPAKPLNQRALQILATRAPPKPVKKRKMILQRPGSLMGLRNLRAARTRAGRPPAPQAR